MNAFENYIASLKGRSVGLIGFGVSNRPLARLLAESGAKVTVYDQKSPEELGDEALVLAELGTAFVSGDGYLDRMDDEILFRSPGFLPTHSALRKAVARGCTVTSEMAMFFALCPCPIIGITGSDGKTTTTTLIAKILSAAGKVVHLGGNIGHPLLCELPSFAENDVAVVELSSFQLMDMTVSPQVAVVTNLSPNHLDKHTDMAEYVEAKRAIFRFQGPDGLLVANADNAYTREFLASAPGKTCAFSRNTLPETGIGLVDGKIVQTYGGNPREILDTREILLPGTHNIENYMAAIGAVGGDLLRDAIRSVAGTFGGVAHRLELVRTLNGVAYYNSSIDSSPTRTMAALRVFSTPVTVIMGGSDKNIAFDELGDVICQKVQRVILTGQTAKKLEDAVRNSEYYAQGKPEIFSAATLPDAVRLAHSLAKPGDTVLLSPACASFDAFRNFEHRGQVFRETVLGL